MLRRLSRVSLVALLLSVVAMAAHAAAPVLTPANFKSPKLRGWINGIPDTGQFLPDSVVVLRVGDRVTNVGTYVREYFAAYPEFRPMGDSTGRVQFLNTLRNRDVLGTVALSVYKPDRFEDRLALREQRQSALTMAVFRRLIADSVTVTEAETREYYEAYRNKIRLRHILVADEATAQNVRRELRGGRITWAAAVRKYTIARNDSGPNGEIGWVSADRLEPNVVYTVYRLKPGDISEPIQDVQGWHLAQVTERAPMLVPEYSIMGKQVRNMLRAVRQDARSERLMSLLRLKHSVVYDTTVAEFAAQHFTTTTQMKQEAFSMTMEVDARTPEFEPADTSRVLARWENGGRYTIDQLVRAFTDIPPLVRPVLTRKELILKFVESIAMEPFIAAHGAAMGLERDSLVTTPMARKLEQLMVERMYSDSVSSRIYVSREDRLAYYEKNKAQYFTYPSVDYVSIYRPNRKGADSVATALRNGADPRAILTADSLAGEVTGSFQHRRQDETGAYHKALFEEMRPGDVQVRGPDKHGDFMVLKSLHYDGGRQLSFDESSAMIAESLQNMREDEALQALVARLAKRFTIVMHPEKLMGIKLVDATIETD